MVQLWKQPRVLGENSHVRCRCGWRTSHSTRACAPGGFLLAVHACAPTTHCSTPAARCSSVMLRVPATRVLAKPKPLRRCRTRQGPSCTPSPAHTSTPCVHNNRSAHGIFCMDHATQLPSALLPPLHQAKNWTKGPTASKTETTRAAQPAIVASTAWALTMPQVARRRPRRAAPGMRSTRQTTTTRAWTTFVRAHCRNFALACQQNGDPCAMCNARR